MNNPILLSKQWFGNLLGAFMLAVLLCGTTVAETIDAGDRAPGFRLQDQNGEWRSLDDWGGKWIALYFYPKDDTPGCTTEACEFRDNIFAFEKLGADIVGVSLDDVESHQEFAAKYHLPFTLLSDPDGVIARAYGVLKKVGPLEFARRESFLIDPGGRIVKHYDDVDPDTHSAEVLADLDALKSARESG
ncbi:thioredoxin-dependent thiol peroxidase [soil metagenome]